MIKNNKKYLGIVFSISILMGLNLPMTTFAATNPSLGAASSFSILGQTSITGISTISGDVGMNNTGASITALTTANVAGTIYATDLVAPSEGILSASVQANASTAYSATIPGLPIEGTPVVGSELNGVTRGPGVYDLTGASVTLSGGILTLDGAGTYVFRVPFNLTSSGSINFINGARACDLFWRVGSDATINGTSFAGTIISSTGIHFGPGVTLDGRALAIGADVTLGVGGTISGPSCATPPVPVVITPSMGGIYSMPWVTPEIKVTKVPTPSSLPFGPGAVTYNYVVTNPGTIPMTKVSVSDDKCFTVTFIGGDVNNDSTLDVTESWNYSCTTTLTQPTTNIVTATGESVNGLTATSRATATVVVGTIVGTVLGVSTTTVSYPSFPNTGLPPSETNYFGIIIISVLLLTGLSITKISKLNYSRK